MLLIPVIPLCLLQIASTVPVYNQVINREVIINDKTEFNCDLKGAVADQQWIHAPVSSDDTRTVATGEELVNGYAEKCSVVVTTNNYKLIINNTRIEDAGRYQCKDRKAEQGNLADYELILLDTLPICQTIYDVKDMVSENSCNIDPDDLQLSCRVKYYGNVAPTLGWKDIGYSNSSNPNTRDLSNTVENVITMKPKWNRDVYTCETSLSHSRCHVVAPKPLFLFNDTLSMEIKFPQKVTCLANTSTSCSYKWMIAGEIVSKKENLELETSSPIGKYLCVAECQIRGTPCIVQPLIITYKFEANNDSGGWKTTSLLIAISLAIILTIVCVIIMLTCQMKFDPYSRLKWILQTIHRPLDLLRTSAYTLVPNEDQENFNWESISLDNIYPPTMINTPGHIKGVTVLEDTIFIVRKGTHAIEEYCNGDEQHPKLIPVSELKEPIDLVSCHQSQCLYISDSVKNAVHVVMMPQKTTTKWIVKNQPEGLSVTKLANVLVTFPKEHKIVEYTSSGDYLRHFNLSETIEYPRHAIRMRNESMLLICSGTNTHNHTNMIFTSSSRKTIEQSYDGGDIFTETKMWPTRLAETKNGFIIAVAHQKVLLLNSNLQMVKELLSAEKNHYPSRMYLDEDHKRLYLTENEENGRILIYDFLNSLPANPETSSAPDFDWTPISLDNKSPTIINTPGHIKGFTVFDDTIFIVRKGTQAIEEYCNGNEQHPKLIPVSELKEPIDLVSCHQNKCLYISDSVKNAVHVVMMPQQTTTKWDVIHQPEGLSVTKRANVLITFPKELKIVEYTSNGRNLRFFNLGGSTIEYPRHAIRMRNESMLLICSGTNTHNHTNMIFTSSSRKTIEQSYDGGDNFTETQMWPTRLAETENGFIIAVAHQKVLLLNSDLQLVKILLSAKATHYPSRMFLDEDNSRLYLTENEENGRILIYDYKND